MTEVKVNFSDNGEQIVPVTHWTRGPRFRDLSTGEWNYRDDETDVARMFPDHDVTRLLDGYVARVGQGDG